MIDSLRSALSGGKNLTMTGLRGASVAYVAGLVEGRPCCCILPDNQMLPGFERDLRLLTGRTLIVVPGSDIAPYARLSPDASDAALRLSALYQMLTAEKDAIILTCAEALARRAPPREALSQRAELVIQGEDAPQDELLPRLVAMGYEQVALVRAVGEFSVRGGIVDIFPPPFPDDKGRMITDPVRLDYFGDMVESIRIFTPISQRSRQELDHAVLLPAQDIGLAGDAAARRRLAERFLDLSRERGWAAESSRVLVEQVAAGLRFVGMEMFLPLYYQGETASFFDYLPPETVFFLPQPEALKQNLALIDERIQANYQERCAVAEPALRPEEIFLGQAAIAEALAARPSIRCTDFIAQDEENILAFPCGDHQLLKQRLHLARRQKGLLPALLEQLGAWREAGETAILCCRSPEFCQALAAMLANLDHAAEILTPPLALESLAASARPGVLYLAEAPLTQGFSLPELKLHLLSDGQLFGAMRLGAKKRERKIFYDPERFAELRPGDVVVHSEHGLGRYLGMETITVAGVTGDFMLLEYRDGDRLYVPADRLNLVGRYEGLSDNEPKLDKLGNSSWRQTKAKVKEEVWKVAGELLDIYAQRELRQGRAFSEPAALFADMEESFPYDETPGQAKAIAEVLADLTNDKPMDRLVCGDVGYGKTEVAIRAAFKVVEDGAQVAVLTPTTVLSEQHAKTFRERLAGLPARIACINRFRSASEQKKIIAALKAGEIDIVIGTHRLLSKDVHFRDLGLLVIDEEHRFGVAQKEKIKKLRAEVDILSLTATPIPRTLQMSLLSIRDLSVISSPPEMRLPVKTFVSAYDELVIKEAISRELRRHGQVFFIHNRVRSIHRVAANIQKLLPEARLAVAHGQMSGKELEEIMVRFVTGQIDVLVCTTIVESGLDIPSANTIIISRADMLGLAEIYQLRGRVGRSSTQSYAYLLAPSLDSLSKESRDRLQALMDCGELGGGFKLAMSDLQIRGGGNLLGVSQSGHIAAIGYDLYLDLLQSTVADLKAKSMSQAAETGPGIDPEINIRISAYIPNDYIADASQRYIMYRRLAALAQADDERQNDLAAELIDRYGAIPDEAANLLRIVALRRRLIRLGCLKLERGPDNLVFTFASNTPVRPERLVAFVAQASSRKKGLSLKLTQDGRLVVPLQSGAPEAILAAVDTVLNRLAQP
ncbi:MAG: transcription-repair coupling factor [Desulfobulbaceae bacterium]|jgi:transcription-repair coupling factor (superfamily II helicase)|nr:transcription-repair coupling factor [Desulfobulbaceae bacterium]